MDQHVKVLGFLYIILGALGIVGALVCLALFGGIAGIIQVAGHASDDADALMVAPFFGAFAVVLFLVIVALSLPGIVAGAGLLKFRSWARILAIVLSGLNLFNMPFGTALGIYGLWVLLARETEPLFLEEPVQAPAPPSPSSMKPA